MRVKRFAGLAIACVLVWLVALFAQDASGRPGNVLLHTHGAPRFAVDFTRAATGAQSLPPGTSFSRASDGYWYPTGAASVAKASAGNNTALIGTFGGTNGLRINPATTNALPTEVAPTTGNGWLAGTAAAPIVNDAVAPDGTTTAARLQPASGEFSNYYGASGAAGRKVASFYGSTRTNPSAQQETSGTVTFQASAAWTATAVWTRRSLAFNNADATTFYFIPSDGRDKSGQGGVVGAAHDLESWGYQVELGHQHATDLVTGGATRAGERFWLTSVPANVGGHLVLTVQFIPYAAPQDLDPNSRVWTTVAGDYAEIDPATRRLTISVGGTAYTLPVAMSWFPFNTVRIGTTAGNGQSSAYYTVNGSAPVMLGLTAGSHAAITTPATIDILSNGATKELSSLLQRVEVW